MSSVSPMPSDRVIVDLLSDWISADNFVTFLQNRRTIDPVEAANIKALLDNRDKLSARLGAIIRFSFMP
jgi:hypothetical protein